MARNKTQRGFNLVEAAIVLGVVGLIIGGIWVAADTVATNRKISQTVEGAMVIARNTQALISAADATTLGDNFILGATLLQAGAIPSNWVINNVATHPYGNVVEIYNHVDIFGPNRFDMDMAAVPQKACVTLVVRFAAMGAASDPGGANAPGDRARPGLGFISVNGTGNYQTMTFPISLADADTACNQALNDLTLTFGYTR